MDESEFYPKDRMGIVDESGWRTVVEQTTLAAGIAREHGLQFSFHPHVGTCVELESQIERLLAETDPASIQFTPDAVTWRSHTFDRHRLAHLRESVMISFGSCSFVEPLTEVRALGAW